MSVGAATYDRNHFDCQLDAVPLCNVLNPSMLFDNVTGPGDCLLSSPAPTCDAYNCSWSCVFDCRVDHAWQHPEFQLHCCDQEGGGLLVAFGILVGLMSSVFINIGQNIQAIGAKQPGADKDPCSSRTWIIGLSLFIGGSLGNMVAMAFASATILVPLESSQFVTNVLFSKYVNKCEITQRQWTGTWLAVLGTVFTCIFGPNDNRCFRIPKLASFWAAPGWIIYVIFTFALAGAGWVAYSKLLKASKSKNPPPIAEVGLPALYAVSSALIGGAQMIVHSKALAELFDMLFSGIITLVELLSHWFFWLELVITAVCGIFWAVQMNNAITLYDPLFIIPLLQASYITFGAMGSGIFYQEFKTLHLAPAGAATWFFYILGMLMVISGIMLLAPPSAMAACANFWKPKARAPMVQLHPVQEVKAKQDSATSLSSPNGTSVQGDDLPARPSPLSRGASSMEMVAGVPGLSSLTPSLKLGSGDGGSKKLWGSLRSNLQGSVESARAAMDSVDSNSPKVAGYDQLDEARCAEPQKEASAPGVAETADSIQGVDVDGGDLEASHAESSQPPSELDAESEDEQEALPDSVSAEHV